ncbi:MAG: hypothetical protein ACT4PU_13905 [Planctomycetota bacterium]
MRRLADSLRQCLRARSASRYRSGGVEPRPTAARWQPVARRSLAFLLAISLVPAASGAALAQVAPAAATAPAPAPARQAPAVRTALCSAEVSESAGLARVEALSFGVPLPFGAVRDPAALRIWRSADQAALPAQARALSRWPDGSLRWALLDTQLALASRESVRLAVGLAPDLPATASTWRLVTPQGQRVTLDAATGVTTDANIAAKIAPLLSKSGAALEDGLTRWPLLDGDSMLGLKPRLVDRFGHVYSGRFLPESLRLLEAGPLRLCLEVRGEHLADAPAASSPSATGADRPETGSNAPAPLAVAFHTFTARIHLLAGQRQARVEWALENTPLHNPTGPLAFRSYELFLDPGPGPRELDVPGSLRREDAAVALRQDGATPGTMSFRIGDEEFRPARADDLWLGLVVPASSGDAANASAISAPRRSLHVQLFDSAHNHPKALLRGPAGPLRIGLLPPGGGREYWLDDATRKTFRFTLVQDLGPIGRQAMSALQRPAHVAIDPRDVAASGAWGDAGLFYVPEAAQLGNAVSLPKELPTGWADWGEWHTKSTRVSGSPRNRLSVWLEAVQSGRSDLWELARARAFHAMDLRPYHLHGFRAADFPKANLNEGLPHENEPPENRLGRTGLAQRFPEWKSGLPAKGHGYNGFDPEHMTLDDVYECWLLTGSWAALDALRSAGEAMLTWRYVLPEGRLHSARVVGWTLRALVQVHRATGEAHYLETAARLVERADRERGRGDVPYLVRMKPDARHLADREYESPWMVAVAVHGLCAYYAATGGKANDAAGAAHAEASAPSGDPRVPPMLADLSRFLMAGWRGNGFVADLPVEGALDGGTAQEPLGTSQWVPGALAAAAFVTGDHRPVDRIYPYYRQLAARSKSPVAFGSSDWHWWQPYLLSLQLRYGDAAVLSPGQFTPPGH